MAKPSVYELGTSPEIILAFTDTEDVPFIPAYSRLSIEEPDGTVVTVSGGDLTVGSGYLSFLYNPPIIGWYQYEAWGKDNANRQITKSSGFEVVDRVF